MDRVRAELDRVKASKAAMAQERSRLAAEALRGEAMELEEMSWRGDKQGTAKKIETQHDGMGGSSTASPMGSLTDDGNDEPGAGTNAGASGARAGGADADDAAAEDESLGNIAGINDDGYFGDASGQWLSLEPDTEITFATGNDKTAWEDLKDCWKLYGLPFATGLFTVVFFTAALIVWSTTSSKLRNQHGPAAGRVSSDVSLIHSHIRIRMK